MSTKKSTGFYPDNSIRSTETGKKIFSFFSATPFKMEDLWKLEIGYWNLVADLYKDLEFIQKNMARENKI